MPNGAPEVFQGYFRKKRHSFLKKNSSCELLEIEWAKITFGKHSEGKYPCLVFLKFFKYSFEKKTSLSPKNPKFWTFSKHMTNSKFRDVFGKRTCEIKCFWKFQNVFFSSDLSILSKKAKFWKFWDFSGSEYFWYIFYLKLAMFFVFEFFLESFLNILSLLQKKKQILNVLRTLDQKYNSRCFLKKNCQS